MTRLLHEIIVEDLIELDMNKKKKVDSHARGIKAGDIIRLDIFYRMNNGKYWGPW